MIPVVLRVVCAWCGHVLVIGSALTPTSHGLCPGCRLRFEQETA